MQSFFLIHGRAQLLSLATAIVLMAPAISHAQAPQYRVEIIDLLPGDVVAETLKVNESGQVLANGTRLVNGWQQPTALVWSGPGQSSTPSLSGFTPGHITDSGNLVGGYNFGVISLAPNGTFTTLTTGQRFDYRTVTAVAPNGDYSGTDGFSGQQIYRSLGGNVSSTGLWNNRKPGRWAGMNNNGDIAGTTDNGNGLTYNLAWVGRNGVITALPQTANGFTGGTYSIDLDSRGRVLARISNGTGSRDAIWETNDVATLLSVPDRYYTLASGFNASSTVIAYFLSLAGNEPAYWGINTPAGNYGWADIADASSASWRVLQLQDISDSGYIVGRAVVNDQIVAFRMTPLSAVPEPSTLLSMLLGGLGLVIAQRRRSKAGDIQPMALR